MSTFHAIDAHSLLERATPDRSRNVALARDANDSAASAYIDGNLFFRVASWVNYHAITLAFLPMIVVFLLVIGKILRGSTYRDLP